MSPLITRRQTLQSLATAAVFASGLGGVVLSLTGCGGHGGDGGSGGGGNLKLRSNAVKVKVALPVGANVSPGTLRVTSALGTTKPNATGEVTVTILNDGPQYAEARDTNGNLVVAGFVSREQTTLDATSTAQVLSTFGLGVAAITGEVRSKVVASLTKATGFADLVAEVERGLKSSGKTTFGAPALEARLDAMFAAAGGGTRAAQEHLGSTRGTIVEPTTEASGIAIDTSVNEQLKLQNVRLRRSVAWIDTISHRKRVGGETIAVAAAKPSTPQAPIKIEPPKRFGGTLGTLKDVIEVAYGNGSIAYTPVEVGPFPIPAKVATVPGCIATEYQLSIAGPGASAGDIAKIGALRQGDINRVYFDGFLLDYFLPIFTAVVIPLKGDEIDSFLGFCNGNAILGDAVNTIFSTAPAIATLMSEGKYYEAAVALRDAGLLSGTFLPLTTDLVLRWIDRFGSDKLYASAGGLSSRASAIFGVIGGADKGLSIADAFVAARDFDLSNRGDIRTVLSTDGTELTLQPVRAPLPANETTNIRAIIKDRASDAIYKFQWSVSEGFRLNDASGKNTDDLPTGLLTTTQDLVLILAKDLKPGLATARCRVFLVDGPSETPVGEASVEVLFTGILSLSPEQGRVERGKTITFTAGYTGKEAIEWRYSLDSTAYGTLSPMGSTNAKTVAFAAGSTEGSAKLTAEAFAQIDGTKRSIGRTTATILIGNVLEPVAYRDIPYVDGKTGYAFRIVAVKVRPGAKRIEVYRNGSFLVAMEPPKDLIRSSGARPYQQEIDFFAQPHDGEFWVEIYFVSGSDGGTFQGSGGAMAAHAVQLIQNSYRNEQYALKVIY